MRMNWVIQVGTVMAGLVALAACSSSSTGTTGTGGETTTTNSTGTGGTAGSTTGTGTFTGTKTCADLLSGTWDITLTGSDFDSEDSFNAYDALNTCACSTDMSGGGCEDLCSQPMNGTTTNNLCNGVAALGQCQYCLNGTGTATGITEHCGSEYTACMSN